MVLYGVQKGQPPHKKSPSYDGFKTFLPTYLLLQLP